MNNFIEYLNKIDLNSLLDKDFDNKITRQS